MKIVWDPTGDIGIFLGTEPTGVYTQHRLIVEGPNHTTFDPAYEHQAVGSPLNTTSFQGFADLDGDTLIIQACWNGTRNDGVALNPVAFECRLRRVR